MRVDIVSQGLAELSYEPLTSEATGELLYELVHAGAVEDVLELGFGHGTSTAYMAAALDELDAGRVTSVDRPDALEREPNIHTVLEHLGLADRVEVCLTASSYNWDLMKILRRQTVDDRTVPCFDFCFLDGAHTWEADGFAFLLVDRLLREDRWILFDDVAWTLAGSPTLRASERVRGLPEEERSAQQVRLILELLVRPSSTYEVRMLGNHALAYKRPAPGAAASREHVFDELVETKPALVRELALGPHGRQSARR
jgi:predicted O-methyltransferase YrrM